MKNKKISGTPKQSMAGDGYDDVSTRIPQIPNPRRAQEENDACILHNDMQAVGNMPRNAIHREFNKYDFNMFEEGKE